jgi:hypothetical protein
MEMMKSIAVVFAACLTIPVQAQSPPADQSHPAPLVQLAKDYRAWQRAEQAKIGDYASLVKEEKAGLADYRKRLEAIDTTGWSVHNKVDYLVLRSEMDELEFDLLVVRQPSRNPDFYTTEAVRRVMRHVGGRYQNGPGVTVPYDAKRAEAIVQALNDTKAIVGQAPQVLTEGVGPMADMAIERLADVRKNYNEFARVVGQYLPEPYKTQIGPAADAAGAALEQYAAWIKSNRAKMTAPYAIGKNAFEWYVQRVLMMPYSSDDLLMQAEMERVRNWAFLEMERQKNRELPEIGPARTNKEFAEWKDATDVLSRIWAERYDLFTRPDYVGAMRDEDGGVWIEPFGLMGFPKTATAPGTKREFLVSPDHWFASIYWEKGHRLDPGTNHPHSDYPGHTFEGAVSSRTTCELRRGHNTRHDAWTDFMEELQLQLDYPFVRGPRAREWMYELAIMRAERVYVSVKFAAGEMTPEQVEQYYMANVPDMEPYVAKRHEVWRKYVDPAQVLTYQVGKFQIYKLMMDQMKRLGDKFQMHAFDDALLATGQIPISLARWEMTGKDDEVKALWQPAPLSSVVATSQHP